MMETELTIAILGVMGAVIVVLLTALLRNGKVHSNPSNPDQVKTGDMSVTYWQTEFRTVVEKLDEIIGLLRDRLPPRGE